MVGEAAAADPKPPWFLSQHWYYHNVKHCKQIAGETFTLTLLTYIARLTEL
jgi:hypothetical protein